MHRRLLVFGLLAAGLIGCNRGTPQKGMVAVSRSNRDGANGGPLGISIGIGRGTVSLSLLPDPPPAQSVAAVELAKRSPYEAALVQAQELLAERKFEEARKVPEAAAAYVDSEAVRAELSAVRERVHEEAGADRAAADIQVVFDLGRAGDAGRLPNHALLQFG